MGTDMTMLYEYRNRSQKWIPIRKDDYIDRDYNMFHALMGRYGYGDPLFPPISEPKGFPEDMSPKWLRDERLKEDISFEKSGSEYSYKCISYLTLKEILDSPFSKKQHFKGWVWEDYDEWVKENGEDPFYADPIDTPDYDRTGLVLRDLYTYPNLTLIDYIITPMKQMKIENGVLSDEDIRMIFWLW